MGLDSLISYLGILLTSILMIFVIWDHFKDDRLLFKQVQDFYNDIEFLIFTHYQHEYYKNYKKITEKKIKSSKIDQPDSSLTKDFSKEKDFERKSLYFMGKILSKFDMYSKYLGLTRKPDEKNKIMNGTEYYLITNGSINHWSKPILTEGFNIKNEDINGIINFLRIVRLYWRQNYYKRWFRPELKSNIDFFKLLGYQEPLEK